jgi:hypothetical protein
MYGAEASFTRYRRSCCWEGWGAFVQYLRIAGPGDSHRFALGYQFPGPLGFEVGAALRTGEAGTSPQLQIAPFASLGLVHLALQLSAGGAPYGSQVALVLGFKLPYSFGNPPPSLRLPSGRPLLVSQGPRQAPLARSAAWC